MAKLLVHENSGVREFELLDAEIHIGRELDNTLRLPDPSISRHHCVIRKVGNAYEIQDLQSSNGVLLNGSRVQSSPLRDGDRVTLGQIQLTFMAPPEPGATVAINVGQTPALNPLGTVRMSPEQMAAIHSGAPAESQPTGGAPIPLALPEPAPVAPPLPPPPAPAPAPIPVSQAPAPVAPSKADPGTAPGFGHFTNHGQGGANHNPAPAFLQPFLPPVPDPATPTGERGEFVPRLIAALIDLSPLLVLQVLSMLVMPASLGAGGLGAGFGAMALMGCLSFLLLVAYAIFIPWCWLKFGATPGKKIMGLRVVLERDIHEKLDLGSAVLRMLGYLVNAIIAWVISIPLSLIFMAGAMSGVHSVGFGTLLVVRVLSFAAGIAPYLMILLPERKGIHDMISKSLCIKVDR